MGPGLVPDWRYMLAVRILGCSGSYAAPGGACTGYLMQSDKANVWLDAGPGTLANLQFHQPLVDLDAIVITHAHPDHWLELPIVAVALKWFELRDPLAVYANQHVLDVARELIGPDVDEVFDWHVITADSRVEIGDQSWSFAETDHYVPTLATRVDADHSSIVFSADTGPAFSFAELRVGGPIDMAIVESTFLERAGNEGVLHLSAPEAAQLAADGEAAVLMLTHQAPPEDRRAHLEVAKTIFPGRVVLAEVGDQYAASGELRA